VNQGIAPLNPSNDVILPVGRICK